MHLMTFDILDILSNCNLSPLNNFLLFIEIWFDSFFVMY